MKKLSALLALVFVFGCSSLQPSSKIPSKRKFPVNTAVSPCENFYEYTCSKVNASFKLPEDRSAHTFSFNDSSERILEFKKSYFKKLKSAEPENQKEKALKNYYLACMNKEARVKEEVAEVERVKKELAGIRSRRQMFDYFANKIISPDLSLFYSGPISNQDNPDYNDIYIDTGLMTLPEKSYYEKEDLVAELKAIMVMFFKEVGVSNPEKAARDVYEFEHGLAQIYPTPLEFRDLVSSRTGITRRQIERRYPNLKLSTFLKEVPKSTHIRNFIPASMKYINEKLSSLSIDQWKNIYLYFAVKGYMDDAYPELFKKRFDFSHKFLGGSPKRADRHERCTKRVMYTFSKEVDFILLPRMFPDFPQEKFVKLAERIRKSIVASLNENTWLSERGRKEAIRKITTAKLQLVKPLNDEEWYFNPVAEYSPETPIANAKKLGLLKFKRTLGELGKPVSKKRWGFGPLTVNAYYSPPYNKFVLPIAILQYPFYDPSLSDAANLAAIGTVIGHELGHGIDDKGSKYDSAGKLRNWMSKKDRKNLAKISQPLIDQFEKIGHNGKLTLGENIGDLVGLTAAYEAAFSLEQRRSGNIPQDLHQAFFLQYGRAWCEVERPATTQRRLKTDPHSLGFARVNEQVKHQPGFQQAFNCKDSDPMVLSKDQRVRIW